MKPDRWFYSVAGAVFIAAMLIGFRAFVAQGTGAGGRTINPVMFHLDLVHGLAIAAWFVLFFVQSLLISVRNRRLHFKLGWSVVPIALAIAVTGTLVAIRSVQTSPPDFQFFGMLYSRFLLPMLAEISAFTLFAATGIFNRKKPQIHRVAMLMASLCLIGGATARMPFLVPVFGNTGLRGLFGPVFCIGAALLIVRCAMTRRLDHWFVAGYLMLVVLFTASMELAETSTWYRMAMVILKL